MKSCLERVVDFESNLKSVQSYKRFFAQKNIKVTFDKSVKIVSNQGQIKISVCVQNVIAITFMYLDMNNLYSWRLSAYLPYGGFEWLKNVVAITFMYLIIKVFHLLCSSLYRV